MDLPKTILVPTDFSPCADAALQYALKLAKQLEARVCVVHAYLMPITSWEGGWAFPQDVITQLEAASRAELDKVLQKARSELPKVEALFYNGDPRDSILKAAEDTGAEMIVIGTHGRRGITRALLGSVAEAVVRRANCVVVTVRHPDKR